MAARGAASIVGLHDALYTRSLAPHLRPEFTYEPHITLARQAEWPKLQAAYEAANETLGGEFSDVIREVVLLSVSPAGKIVELTALALYSG
jgi:hypothetical protein